MRYLIPLLLTTVGLAIVIGVALAQARHGTDAVVAGPSPTPADGSATAPEEVPG